LLTTSLPNVDGTDGGGRGRADNWRVEGREFRIRAATGADLDRVLELWAKARTAYAVTPDSPEATARLFARDPEALLVAELDGGPIVGALIAAFDGWRGNMYRLAVEPGRRRGGIGRSLIAAGERRLRALGAARVTVLIAAEDEVAVAAWEAAGYARDPIIARHVKNL
jgi:ribosomal protein S18 acetylase RimI-like enzyme